MQFHAIVSQASKADHFDIFKHHRRSGMLDKYTKLLWVTPSGDFTDLGRRDLPQPMASLNPNGCSR